jgi:hypothetical protein
VFAIGVIREAALEDFLGFVAPVLEGGLGKQPNAIDHRYDLRHTAFGCDDR